MESLENLYYAYMDWAISKITAISSDCRTFRLTCLSFRHELTVGQSILDFRESDSVAVATQERLLDLFGPLLGYSLGILDLLST